MRRCAFESYPKGVTFNHKLSAVLNDVLEGKKAIWMDVFRDVFIFAKIVANQHSN